MVISVSILYFHKALYILICFYCVATYITTGTRRLAVGKTEFRLSRIGHEDRWVHLKRADYKTGFAFKINRQVRLIPFTPNSGIDLSKRSSAPTQN